MISEIEYLVKERQVNFLQINDDNFFSGNKVHKIWIAEFCEKMRQKNIKVDFFIYARANDIIEQADMLQELKEVGLKQVFVGFESFNSRQLKFYNKGITIEQNKQAFKILAHNKVPIIMGFMVLEPYVTIDELIENIRVLEELKYYNYICDTNLPISLYPKVIPYNGTPLYEFYEKSNLLNRNDFVNTDVNEWYNYLLRWIERLKKCYNEINGIGLVPTSSKRKILVEFHKLDVEYWARSLDMVKNGKNGKNDNCCGLIEEQFEKVKKIMLGNFENF